MTLEKIELKSKQEKSHSSKNSKTTLAKVTLTPMTKIPSESLQKLPKVSIQTLETTSISSENEKNKEEREPLKKVAVDTSEPKLEAKKEEKGISSSSPPKTLKKAFEDETNIKEETSKVTDFQNVQLPEKPKRPPKKKKAVTYNSIEKNGFTQNYFSFIEKIYGGLIVTKNKRYIYIMEIFPNNFNEKNLYEQQKILNQYMRFYSIAPIQGHLKCITEVTDINTILRRIRQAGYGKDTEKRKKIREDHIKHILNLSQSQTVNYRYFYIFEYEGNDYGYRSKDENEIYEKMMSQKNVYKEILYECNNMVAEPDEPNMYTLEILYQLLNRSSYRKESLASRILRINHDCEKLGIEPDIASYIAPKDLILNYSKEYLRADGLYQTYITILDYSYPRYVEPNWLTHIRAGEVNLDIDFFQIKRPHESTKNRMERRAVWNKVSARQSNRGDKREEYEKKAATADYIKDSLEAGEEVFDCCTVITLLDTNPERLMTRCSEIQKTYRSAQLHTESAYMDTMNYYFMTLPFLKFRNKIFERNKRNMTSSAMKNSYCFTNYSLLDQSSPSVVVGRSVEHGTLYALNRFNTSLHINPHVTLIGTSGSGKSFLEMGFGRRDNLVNMRTFYILPLKAFEYIDHCKAQEGTYIRFGSQANMTYNIMELYPENVMRKEKEDAQLLGKSILANKIISLCTWIRILSILDGNSKYVISSMDINRISKLLKELYADFGITDDDESIWEDKEKGKKKYMPILSYWEERMREDSMTAIFADLLLPFTKGAFSNYNRQSNVDVSKDTIICDVEKDDIGEEMHPAVMYLAYDLCSNIIKSDADSMCSLYLDEIWSMMISEIIGKKIQESIRILRGYGCSVVSASQQIEEFVSNKYGRSIIANSATKILMSMEPEEVDKVAEVIPLDNSDKSYLMSCKPGDMLVITRSYRFRCHFDASLDECIAYNTDPVKKAEFIKIKENTVLNNQ